MSEALEAIRSGDFDTGISFFSDLVKKRADYHVGWLRLGHVCSTLFLTRKDEYKIISTVLAGDGLELAAVQEAFASTQRSCQRTAPPVFLV